MVHLEPFRAVCALALGLLTLAASACGGRAALEAPDETDPGAPGRGGAASDNAGGGGARSSPQPEPDDPSDVGDVSLPACVLGFSSSRPGARDCTYVFEELCYPSSLAACACACRGLANSNCIISGFLDPDAPQRVSCRAR